MSLNRLVYYSAVIGGWAAFVGWLLAEFVVLGGKAPQGTKETAEMCGVVGAAIGAGLNVIAGVANGHWKQLVLRIWPGLLGGGLGGAMGGALGEVLTTQDIHRAFGFIVVGMVIGIVEGLYERSAKKIRNGLIGGALGGFIGGLALDWMLTGGSQMSSRATAFVLLGLCIGALIGIAQVVLKDAWLTVLDGYGVGRQLILSREVTVLGRSDMSPMPFLGRMNENLEREHLRIIRQPNGSFVLEDNNSTIGTSVNHQPVKGSCVLSDEMLIKFGSNMVKFNERRRSSKTEPDAVPVPSSKPVPRPPKPAPAPVKRGQQKPPGKATRPVQKRETGSERKGKSPPPPPPRPPKR